LVFGWEVCTYQDMVSHAPDDQVDRVRLPRLIILFLVCTHHLDLLGRHVEEGFKGAGVLGVEVIEEGSYSVAKANGARVHTRGVGIEDMGPIDGCGDGEGGVVDVLEACHCGC
jgi:hypothetical protein